MFAARQRRNEQMPLTKIDRNRFTFYSGQICWARRAKNSNIIRINDFDDTTVFCNDSVEFSAQRETIANRPFPKHCLIDDDSRGHTNRDCYSDAFHPPTCLI